MPWQKEFTLSRRSKGCHLVTEEVLGHIRPGVENVKVTSNMAVTRDKQLSYPSR